MRFTACHGLAVFLSLLFVAGCTIAPHGERAASAFGTSSWAEDGRPRVAILGIVKQEGIGADVVPGWTAKELGKAIRSGGRRSVLSMSEARRSLGRERDANLRNNFRRSAPIAIGEFSGASATRPPADFGLIVRIDRDTVAREVVSRESVVSTRDAWSQEREILLLKTERKLVVSALLIDLNRSREVWFRRYEDGERQLKGGVPFKRSQRVNTLASTDQGPASDVYPPTPVARDILRRIVRKVAADLPASQEPARQ